MIIGVFSDVHDHIANLSRMLEIFAENKISTLIFCGDFCSPIPSRVMGAYAGEVHCVFGNGDGDRFTIHKIASTQFKNLHLHGEHAALEFEGVQIAVTHYPFYAQALARTGDFNAVFSGHTHIQSEEWYGDCLWLNPGEVLGWKGSPTCAIYDTTTQRAEVVKI
jgi:putative phosphoesterase